MGAVERVAARPRAAVDPRPADSKGAAWTSAKATEAPEASVAGLGGELRSRCGEAAREVGRRGGRRAEATGSSTGDVAVKPPPRTDVQSVPHLDGAQAGGDAVGARGSAVVDGVAKALVHESQVPVLLLITPKAAATQPAKLSLSGEGVEAGTNAIESSEIRPSKAAVAESSGSGGKGRESAGVKSVPRVQPGGGQARSSSSSQVLTTAHLITTKSTTRRSKS